MSVNITDFMSFDLDWFTTLPGMLITGGVVVLLIALIVFIVSNKKGKKANPEVSNVNNDSTNQPVVDNSMANATIPDMGQNTQFNNGMGLYANMPNNPVINPINNLAGSVTDNNANSNPFGTPSIPTINTAPTTGPVDNSSTPSDSLMPNFGATNNVINPISNVNNDVTTNSPEPVVPNTVDFTSSMSKPAPVEISNQPAVETVDNANANITSNPFESESKPLIYGGVDPANTIAKQPVETVKPVVYGGANPLENTTTIPTVSHDAYGIPHPVDNTPNVTTNTVIDPVQTPTPSQPEPVSPQPMPSISNVNPSVEPVVNVTFTTPDVLPTTQPITSTPSVTQPATVTVETDSSMAKSNTPVAASEDIETLEF